MTQGFAKPFSLPDIPPNQGINIIQGGNFDTNPWQRGTSLSVSTNNIYLADRFAWYISTATPVITMAKTADAPTVTQAGIFTQNCISITVTTADAVVATNDWATLGTNIEGYDFAQIAQRTFTLSFWHKHSKTGIYCVSFRSMTAGLAHSYVAEYEQAVSDTWEFTTITVPASPSAGTWDYTFGVGLSVLFTHMAGTTYQTTPNTWTAGNLLGTANQVNGMDTIGNVFRFALIQLEAGSVATPFEIRSYAEELQLCQRYYIRRISGGANSILLAGGMQTGAATLAVDYFKPMRTNPIFTYDGTNTNWNVIINSTTIPLTGNMVSPSTNASGIASISVPCTASVGFASWLASANASAWLAWDAELT